jgi:hypothetical protein
MNEPLLREVNRRIYGLTAIKLHATEFADILPSPGCMLVAPGHEAPGLEIVRERRGYLMVRETDPASTHTPTHTELSPAGGRGR